MRHRRKGRKLGRNPSHQRALLRSLATRLFLTERDAEDDDNKPKVKGRIITTIEKAKEVRPLVERCITIARHALPHQEAADELEPNAERNSEQWRAWRKSDRWQEWNQAIAPVVAARRRALRLLGDKQAVRILFDEIAPRFADRHGGYTRVLRLAKPRLGDAGTRAILEFVGVRDRVSAAVCAAQVSKAAEAPPPSSQPPSAGRNRACRSFALRRCMRGGTDVPSFGRPSGLCPLRAIAPAACRGLRLHRSTCARSARDLAARFDRAPPRRRRARGDSLLPGPQPRAPWDARLADAAAVRAAAC